MFDLNQQISQWRQSLGQSESIVRSDLDELESHLRDQIEHLAAAGLSQQEAFLVTQHRIGDASTLPTEFAKVNSAVIFRRRLQWMLIGILAYLVIVNLSLLASVGGTLAAYGMGFHGYMTGWIGQSAKYMMAMVGLAMIFLAMKNPGITRRAGSVAGGLFIVIGTVLLIAAQLFITFLTTRYVDIEDYGKSTLIQHVSTLANSVLIPILVVILLILLRGPARQRELGVS